MNFQNSHAESSTSAIINFNNSNLDSDTEMLHQDSDSEMHYQNSNSETITGSEVENDSISDNGEIDNDEIDDFNNNDDDDDDVYDYDNSSLDFSKANPAVLQSCILSSFVIFHPPITRDGQIYTLKKYLNTFLYPVS